MIRIRRALRFRREPNVYALVAFAVVALFLLRFAAEYASSQIGSALDKPFFDQFSLLLATLVGAWAGGAAAFAAERKQREEDQRLAKISAGNKAIFVISQIFTVVENLRLYCLRDAGLRQDPDRAVKMDSPQPDMVRDINFNFDELGFLLDQPGPHAPQILVELMHLEWQYEILRSTINLRAEGVKDFVKAQYARAGQLLPLDAAKQICGVEHGRLHNLTDQFVELIDEVTRMTRAAYSSTRAALAEVFPGQGFLEINELR